MARILTTLLIAALAAGCTAQGEMSATPDPTATPAPATPPASSSPASPGPTATEPGVRFEFERTLVRDGAELSAVTAFDGGFIAVGCVLLMDGPCERGLILGSPDGRAWHEVAVPDAAGRRIIAVGVTSLGLLALGSTQNSEPPQQRAMWRSLDGETWETYAMDAPTSIVFDQAASVSGRTVLIGSDSAFDLPAQTEVWASVDGRTWSAGTSPLTLKIAAHPGLVAVGDECEACEDPSTRVFRSSDGLEWAETDVPPEMARTAVTDLASLTGRAIVAGVAAEDGAERAVLWFDEPAGWRQILLGDADEVSTTTIEPAPGGILVAAYGASTGSPLAWWSAYGIAWLPAQLDGLDGGSISASAADDRVIVILSGTSIWVSSR